MTPLDLECLLAAIGPARILAGQPTMHKYQMDRAAAMPREIRRRVLRFLGTDSFQPADELPEFDWEAVFKLVSGGEDPQRAAALYAVIPDGELATDLGTRAATIQGWANAKLPREPRTVAYDESMPLDEPSPSAVAEFRRQWEVANDPMVVIDDLEDGSLIDDQVTAVAELYPAIYAEMRQAVSDGVAANKARKGQDWEPSATKDALLGTLRQKDVTDHALAAAVQQVYAQEAAAAAQPTPAPRKAKSIPEMTPGAKASGGGGSITPS